MLTNLRTCKEAIKRIYTIKYVPGDVASIFANIDGVKYITKTIGLYRKTNKELINIITEAVK